MARSLTVSPDGSLTGSPDVSPDTPPLTVPILPGLDEVPGTERGARRAFATRLFHRVAQALDHRIDGPLTFLGEGLWHHAWAARLGTADWVLRIPHGPASHAHDGRLLKEARLLPWLAAHGLDARIPQPVALAQTPLGLASVQTRVSSLQVPEDRLLFAVAEAAQAVHAVAVPPGEGWLERYPTRLDHGLERLACCRSVPLEATQIAADWIEAHLPPPTPARILHGDLMAQNQAVDVDGSRVLIDWAEALIGDPAFDICVVTRGVRRPLGRGDGRRRLLEHYHQRGGDPGVTLEHIYLQELALTAEWLGVPARPEDHDDALARLLRLIKHLGA